MFKNLIISYRNGKKNTTAREARFDDYWGVNK